MSHSQWQPGHNWIQLDSASELERKPAAPFPSRITVALLTLGWLIWILVSFGVMIWAPTPLTLTQFLGVMAVPVGLGAISLCRDMLASWISSGNGNPIAKKSYSCNLGSTVLTLLISMVAFPILYDKVWYQNRVTNTIEFSQDYVNQTYFPSIALFQQSDWSSQANLSISAPPKCFLGWHDEAAPDCNLVAPGTTPCQCAGSWDEQVGDFLWQNTSYRSLVLRSTAKMVSSIPTTQMLSQAFFTFDSAKALADSSHVLSPSLWMAIYDPTLDLQEALENGYTRMSLINANGVVAINLGLHQREALGKAPAYDYQVSMSTIPSMDLRCDISQGVDQHCFVTLIVQFPTFQRHLSRQGVVLAPADVLSEVGSWYALVQLAGWIFSGLAFHAG